MRKDWGVGFTVIASLLLAPTVVRAQAIGGRVTDTVGGVLPGVTVEARSPALIEQVRTAVTDGAGQYLIVELQPGTYSVTFTLGPIWQRPAAIIPARLAKVGFQVDF